MISHGTIRIPGWVGWAAFIGSALLVGFVLGSIYGEDIRVWLYIHNF